jgi:hypothetical protein
MLLHFPDVMSCWLPSVSTLAKILQKSSKAADVNQLWADALTRFMFERCVDIDSSGANGGGLLGGQVGGNEADARELDPDIIRGLMHTDGKLEESLQIALLTNNCWIPGDVNADMFTNKTSEGIVALGGVEEKLRIRPDNAGLRQAVVEMMDAK